MLAVRTGLACIAVVMFRCDMLAAYFAVKAPRRLPPAANVAYRIWRVWTGVVVHDRDENRVIGQHVQVRCFGDMNLQHRQASVNHRLFRWKGIHDLDQHSWRVSCHQSDIGPDVPSRERLLEADAAQGVGSQETPYLASRPHGHTQALNQGKNIR